MPARARKPALKVAPPPKSAPVGLATPDELSAYLRKPLQTLANWRWLGKGPKFTKVGRDVRYEWADVYAWEKNQPQGGAGVRKRRRASDPADAHGSAA
jgi:hypothetical protein